MSELVSEMYAFVSLQPNGDEAVVAVPTETGQQALIATTREYAEALLPVAQEVADVGQMTVTMLRFVRDDATRRQIQPAILQ